MDQYCIVKLLSQIPNPQTLVWQALHRDYCEDNSIFDDVSMHPKTEKEAGEKVTNLILKKKHFGPLEHPQIIFEICGFPHSVPMQMRTHRTGISFDVTSQRYCGQRIIEIVETYNNFGGTQQGVVNWVAQERTHLDGLVDLTKTISPIADLIKELEKVFYVRPAGDYTDRNGTKFTIDEATRIQTLLGDRLNTAKEYYHKHKVLGWSEEVGRDDLCQGIRQSFIMSANLRTTFHLMDMRTPLDAQWEIRQCLGMIAPYIKEWVPEIWNWYESSRLGKNQLAP
jgi:thymidylate synthase (FAD)